MSADYQMRYTVALASARNLPEWLAFVQWAQEAFGQEPMYIEIAGQPEIIDFRAG